MIRETDKTAGHVLVTYSPVEREPRHHEQKSGDEGGGPESNHGIVNYHKALLTKTETKEHGYEHNSRDHR